MRWNEGLTGWVARERRLLAISREAYKDPRFKTFGELPEDSFEAFLSAPVIARNRVVGVINVQHRLPHQHTGSEMEVLTTVGEQVGCVLVLARMAPTAVGIGQSRGTGAFVGPGSDETIEPCAIPRLSASRRCRSWLALARRRRSGPPSAGRCSISTIRTSPTCNFADLQFPSATRGVAVGVDSGRHAARSRWLW